MSKRSQIRRRALVTAGVVATATLLSMPVAQAAPVAAPVSRILEPDGISSRGVDLTTAHESALIFRLQGARWTDWSNWAGWFGWTDDLLRP